MIIAAYGDRYDESSEYQMLIRVIEEQTDKDSDGKLTLKSKKSGMNSEILQNPADPDATFREKAGKDNRGYIANVVEAADKNVRLVTTGLKGIDVADIYADFKFPDDGKQIISCPSGHKPKSNVYDMNTQKCKASFPID